MDEEKYREGFDDGYLLATYSTGVADALSSMYSQAHVPYLDGFKDGVEEKRIERQVEDRQNRIDELNQIRGRNQSRESEIEQWEP